jgi:tetrahydromethanopterin S-methyltransferase subunit C
MMVLALAGSLFTLYIVRRVRVLRARPASQWRVRRLTPKEKRNETLQIAISTLTILLIVAEIVTHVVINHAF